MKKVGNSRKSWIAKGTALAAGLAEVVACSSSTAPPAKYPYPPRSPGYAAAAPVSPRNLNVESGRIKRLGSGIARVWKLSESLNAQYDREIGERGIPRPLKESVPHAIGVVATRGDERVKLKMRSVDGQELLSVTGFNDRDLRTPSLRMVFYTDRDGKVVDYHCAYDPTQAKDGPTTIVAGSDINGGIMTQAHSDALNTQLDLGNGLASALLKPGGHPAALPVFSAEDCG